MPIKLPVPIEDYFNADRNNSDAVAQCFSKNAIVKDENNTYKGLTSIKLWNTNSAIKYNYTAEPSAIKEINDKSIVTCIVTGNFPGSPIDLNYHFSIENNKILSLEILP